MFVSLATMVAMAQVPPGINYQAVARDQAGNVLKNTSVTVRLAIRQGGPDGTVVWQEDHPVTTNAFGLFTLMIGDPDATITGGTVESFDEIDWGAGDYFLQVSLDAGEGFQTFDPVPFLSVPYAKVAGRVTGGWQMEADTLVYMSGSVAIGTPSANGSKLAVQGDDVTSSKPLFEVKRKDGQTVFAVYNDSIRMYVNATPGKGPRGGFAIGGFDAAKGPGREYMRITPDSVRIYIDQSKTKGPRGGFAIGGFDAAKGGTARLMQLTKENYFIGHQSGEKITTGLYNQFFGFQAGMNTTEGSNNIFMGYQAGYSSTKSYQNIFIGKQSGYNTLDGYGNVYIGNETGHENKSGNFNSFIGYRSGYNNESDYNSFFGYRTGYSNTEGSWNTFFGFQAGYSNTIGNYNTFLGPNAGFYNTEGSYNSYIGYFAGFRNLTGESNTCIGYQAGYSEDNANGSNNVSIGVRAGYGNMSGHDNIAIGNQAGENNKNGNFNIFIGTQSGQNAEANFNTFAGYMSGTSTSTGGYNAFYGYNSGTSNTTGSECAYFGYSAGAGNTGSDNTFLGGEAGYYSGKGTGSTYIGLAAGREATGSRNVFVGRYAGYSQSGDDKLVIETNYLGSDNLNNALIYGDFNSDYIRFNANVSVKPTSSSGYALYVYGNVYATGSVTENSDIRLKKDIVTYDGALDKIARLRGVRFDWRTEDFPGRNLSQGPDIGFIAQEVEKVVPQIVTEGPDGYKAVDYSKMTVVLLQAIKEQQKQIEALKQEIEALKAARK